MSGKNLNSFWGEHLIASVPPVVASVVGVDIPLAVIGVPVHVHNAGVFRIQGHLCHHPLNTLWIVYYSGRYKSADLGYQLIKVF